LRSGPGMSEELANEVEAINSIYGEESLRNDDEPDRYILAIHKHDISLRLVLPDTYPYTPPRIDGTEATGGGVRKGYGAHVLAVAQGLLGTVFNAGSVCLFDMMEELDAVLTEEKRKKIPVNASKGDEDKVTTTPGTRGFEPEWTVSAPATEKKSVFLARACPVSSPEQAQACIKHLLATDKRTANATHNITAYRIRSPPLRSGFTKEIVYQDCDDDGESAAGGRLLHLMQLMDVWGVLVMVTRWYGGVKLGPDRFRIINTVAREAIIGTGEKK